MTHPLTPAEQQLAAIPRSERGIEVKDAISKKLRTSTRLDVFIARYVCKHHRRPEQWHKTIRDLMRAGF